jgi:hypothetical protein
MFFLVSSDDILIVGKLSRVVPTIVETFVLSQQMCQVAIANATRLLGTDWKTLWSVRLNIRDLGVFDDCALPNPKP